MAPPPSRPAPSRTASSTSQYVDATDGRQSHQAGRSTTNIHAQSSAQSLREQARPSLLRKKSRPQPTLDTSVNSIPAATHPPPDAALPPTPAAISPAPAPPPGGLHAPYVSSRLNTASSSSTHTSDEELASASSASRSAAGAAGMASMTATAAGAALAAEMLLTPSGSGAQTPSVRIPLLQNASSRNDSSLSLTRQTTPRSVRDLGSDYTRYFNPFATHNNSQQDLLASTSTFLPHYNASSTHLSPAASTADLSKRLSNPFNDTKLYSSAFESRQATAPGTPQPANEKDRMAGVATATSIGAAKIQKPGTPNFIREADPEKAAFFPFMDDRLGAPEYAFPLFTDQKEDDDDLHMPMWDDDIRLKPHFKDHFTQDNIVSTFGMIFMILGLLCIFVVLPVVSYTGTSIIDYEYETPLDQMGGPDQAQAWATVNDVKYSLMSNIRSGLIDPDTPQSAKTRKGVDGDEYILVFSDEFNAKNRSFYPGDDPYWYGFDGWYYGTQDLEWYDPDAINTGDGVLSFNLDAFDNHNVSYRSGMLHSWNQLCFKGGIFEVSMSLPGPAGVHGWWPGVWSMGNLGRPGYPSTTDGMWPYTYDTCDGGIAPNQSMTDGTSHLPGQRLPSCTCFQEDHPTPGTGRGAPEIDIAEVSGDWGGLGLGVATQSYQVAPFDVFYYPNYEFMETPDYNTSFVNTYTGGPYQEAISTTSMLNNNWYDGVEYQKYAFEYVPGGDEDSFIAWIIGEEETMRFDARAVGPNGNVGQRLISEEPMSLILNFGFSHSWVDIDWAKLRFPAVMRVDYVRWYQKEGAEMVTCDPPGYETTEYIHEHPDAYNNPNFTLWDQTGYSKPKNTLMDGCEA